MEYPNAVKVVNKSFYIDGCQIGANSITEAVALQTKLDSLFSKEFQKCSNIYVPFSQNDVAAIRPLSPREKYIKTFGIKWNAAMDHFPSHDCQVTTTQQYHQVNVSLRHRQNFWWISPTALKVKIILERICLREYVVQSTIATNCHRWEVVVDHTSQLSAPKYLQNHKRSHRLLLSAG